MPIPKEVKPYWKMKKTGNSAELILYGEISNDSFWGDEVTPKQISDELKAMGDDVTEIHVRLNSVGGDVFAGVAIHALLTQHKATVVAHVDGVAASIASYILMAADKRIFAKGSMAMIHRPMSGVGGTSEDMRARADLLDTIQASIASRYSEQTGISVEECNAMMKATTWMTAEEALSNGFATEIDSATKIAACLTGDNAIINGVEMPWKHQNAPKLEPKIEAHGRNLDLEIKSLELQQI